jgi:NADP-dependent 3-hydroxy acid dehydrogenase YdfG
MQQTILITGATSGIGSFLSQHFAKKDFTLFLHGRDKKKLIALERELKYEKALFLQANFSSQSEIKKMFETIAKETNSIDVLVNNAFGKLEDPITKADPDSIVEFFQVSLAGTAEVIRLTIPLLKKSKDAHIINIVADWGFPMHNIMTGPSLYIAAKYGIHGLGAALQTEISSLGIRTTNVCPGIVAANTKYGTSSEAFLKENGNQAIHPIDIANTIEFVLAQKHSQIRSIVLSPVNPKYNGL